jgi:hypothetical protein
VVTFTDRAAALARTITFNAKTPAIAGVDRNPPGIAKALSWHIAG